MSDHLDLSIIDALYVLCMDKTVPARDRISAAKELREWINSGAGKRPQAGGADGGLGDEIDPGTLTVDEINQALARIRA